MPPLVKPVKYTVLVGLVIVVLIVLVFIWHRPAAADPAAAFKSALQAGLTQQGVTCTIDQSSDSGDTNQIINIDLKHKNMVRSLTTIKTKTSTITTEEIDTKTDTYVRYTKIETSQTRQDGAKPDVSRAVNVWSKQAANSNNLRLFDKTILGGCAVPLGDLTAGQMKPIADQLTNGKVFSTDPQRVRDGKIGDTPVKIFQVTIQPGPYVSLMKQVAKVYGISYLDDVRAEDYAKKTPEQVKFSVDVKRGRLLKVENEGQKKTISFTDYGVVPEITIPKTTVSSTELEQRLKSQ